jgi:ACS family tartrate transporter-like MFS transporter
MKKIRRRLLPFLALCLIANYLDRVNIGFAALSMNKDLNLSPLTFGLGSGVFFLTYALFEVPSNFILERVGARLWIARILLSWGLVSALMAFAWNDTSFLVLRLLLGLAEAGFVPGVVLYLTYWMPYSYRAVAISGFMLAIPVSSIIGAPISGLILSTTDGVYGLKSWQWMFLLEATPSLILGALAFLYLTDKPQNASWLLDEEKLWLKAKLESENTASKDQESKISFWRQILNRHVALLSMIYFGVVLTLYGLVFWLPQIVHDFGYGTLGVSLLTALPYTIGAIAMISWSRYVDHHEGHIRHAIYAALLSSLGLGACTFLSAPLPTIFALCLSAAGTFGMFPIFWTLATSQLAPRQAAGAIALINSFAALAGFLGPYLVGWIKDTTGAFHYALPLLALGPLISAILLFLMLRQQHTLTTAV